MQIVDQATDLGATVGERAQVHVRLLGGFEATVNGVPLVFRSEKVRALFAYLLVEHDAAHRRNMLATLLWGGQSEEQALVNLRMTLLRLREALAPAGLASAIEADRVTIQFRMPKDGRVWCDVLMLQCILNEQAAMVGTELPQHDVLALARGDFLAGLELRDASDFEDWARTQNAIFQQRLLVLLGWCAEAFSARNDHERAIEAARAMVTLDPWREESHQTIMRLHARAGRRSSVLKHYQELEERLRSELGISPSTESQALLRSLLEQQPVTPAGAQQAVLVNLPRVLTPFVPRPALVDALVQHVTQPDTRLVTLLGMGGSGKTRAAIEAARTAAPAFVHGVQFVPLADVALAGGVAPAILARVGSTVNPRVAPEEQLIGLLQDREMLLVLDNFDHLTEAVAMIGRLCDLAPRIHVLVTSRHRLNLGCEWVVECGGMPYPAYLPAFEGEADARLNKPLPSGEALRGAVELFVQSARRLAPSFMLDARTLPGVLRICALVEGLPLGVELAAASVRGMSPSEIADQIEQHADILRSDEPDRLDRHRSLRVVFLQSWNLLTETEREALCLASIFRDGFSTSAALHVRATDMPEATLRQALAGLADKSFLYRRANQRFAMHELIRQFVREGVRLQTPAMGESLPEDRHAHYYLGWLAGLVPQFKSGGQQAVLNLIRDELENVHAAWRHACARQKAEPAFAREMADAAWPLTMFGDMRGRVRDSLELLTLAVESGGPDPDSLCWLKVCLGHVLERAGRYDEGIQLLTLCLNRLGGNGARQAHAHLGLGKILHRQNKIYEAVEEHSRALALYEQVGDTHGCAIALHCRGMTYEEPHDLDAAWQDLSRARELWRQTGDLRGLGLTLNCMGIVREMRGDFRPALALYQQSLAVFKQLNDLWGQGMALGNIGDVQMALRNHPDALRIQCINLQMARDIWNVPGMLVALAKCGQVLWQLGRWQDAVQAIALAIDMPAQQTKFREIAQGILDQAFELHPADDVRDLHESALARSLDVTVNWMLAQARSV